MKALLLRSPGEFSCTEVPSPQEKKGERVLKVASCAICRTDAKICRDGHRDLVLPRIPGHEFCVFDEAKKKLYAVWPGGACGTCESCLGGAENLCPEMRICGFHRDGGFAEYVSVPEKSLIPAPGSMPQSLVCLAEPLACVLNALSKADIKSRETLIVGAGPLGLMAAVAVRTLGGKALLLENNPEKVHKCAAFCEAAKINMTREVPRGGFQVSINAASGITPLSSALGALRPRGSFIFFSGLGGGDSVPAKLFNDFHYRELNLIGAYGCTRAGMEEALQILSSEPSLFSLLIEKKIALEELPDLIPELFTGMNFKIIVEF
ncbi:MAG: hypothetical protein A2X49_12860 [Lentisphaerae bacterium GWF2_52_8]|nr:MAG: hypothetical protein A2X49_12860 [Lentisphaerae bacterium GWF2_52_8]